MEYLKDTKLKTKGDRRTYEILVKVIFKCVVVITFINISITIDFTDDMSTLVQIMTFGVSQQAITWANVDPDPSSPFY